MAIQEKKLTDRQFLVMAFIAAISSGGSSIATKYSIEDKNFKVIESIVNAKVDKNLNGQSSSILLADSERRQLERRIDKLENKFDELTDKFNKQQNDLIRIYSYNPNWRKSHERDNR